MTRTATARRRNAAWGAGACVALAAAFGASACERGGPSESAAASGGAGSKDAMSDALARPAFVDEASCAECHPKEAGLWRGSDHDRALELPDETTVLGDFADARFTLDGEELVFRREGERYVVESPGPDGGRVAHDVLWTFGFRPLQQVLVDLGEGKVQALTAAWDVEGARWFDLLPGEETAPGEGLHWQGSRLRWNSMCAECHSTAFEKRYDTASDAYDSRFAVEDVGCQACHGPGEAHVAWARGERSPREKDFGLVLARGDAAAEIDRCAPCHSRRHRVAPTWTPGERYLDAYAPELLREGLYYADGQILEEVYVYGSFVQSRMHSAGVRCSDCHDPHALGAIAAGNALCIRCHTESPPLERFPTLKRARYDDPAHHHHAPGSAGAQCVACHMPEKTYMVVDPRRDHSFRVPRPDLALELGVPDACTGCHTDRGAAWAAEAARAWWGEPDPADQGHARVFAAAREGRAEAGPELAALAGDATRAPIVRATALELLAFWGPGARPAIAAGVLDPEPLVRRAALEALDALPFEERPALAGAGLTDPVRAVRVAAARVLAPAHGLIAPGLRPAFEAALVELDTALAADVDLPDGAMGIAILRERLGRADEAFGFYVRALQLDPRFTPARHNLAGLLDARGRSVEAAGVLGEGRALDPDDGELAYGHGLALAAAGRMEESAEALERAVELLPRRARVWRNLGQALIATGRYAEAERALRRATRIDRDDPDLFHSLAAFLLEQGRPLDALAPCARLVELLPDDPNAAALLKQVEGAAAAAPR